MEGAIINRMFEYNKKLIAGCRGGTLLIINSTPQNKESPLEVFKGQNIKDAQQESIGSIIEVACGKDSSDSQAHFVIGTDTNQLINVQLETKDRNSDDFKWD